MKKRRFSFGIENMGSLIRGGYQLVYVLLLAGIILSVLGSYLGIKKIDGISVFVLLSVSLFVICLGNGRGRVRMFPVVGLFSALALTMLSVGLHNAASFLRSYIYWALNAEGWNAQWVRGYELLQHVYVAVGAYLLVRISHRDFRIKAGIALLCLGWLAYSLFTKKALSQAGVVLVVILLVIILSEWVQRRWEKVRRQGMETYIFWLLPFLILYTVLLLLMPAPEKPYDWQFAKDAYGRLKETAKKLSQQIRIGKGDTYDFAFSGFSENSGIGAGIVSDDREMMVLKSDYGFMTNIYLIGKVYDTFDGKKWTAQSRENGWDRYLDTAQTLYAAERFDKQYTRDYISRIEFTIRLSDLRSRYVLAPLKTWSLQRERRALVLEPEGDNLLAADIMSYGVEYDASYYQLNAGSKIFADFLSADLTPDEEILGKILSNSESRIGVRITPEDLTKHEERVYVHYMGKSALSDEAEAYLREMTKDAKSLPEELKSIEEELSSFTYTKTPGEYPQEIDSPEAFLDYFLLRSRQGYCNHFATAFVLLAREKGIPARYVQGFCVPAAGKKEVTVYSHMAHAWPEVYLDGIGWIPFEPTPGFARIRYTPWKLLQGANRSEEERDTAGIEEAKRQSLENVTDEDPEKAGDPLQEASEREMLRRFLKILLMGLGITLLGVAFAFFIERLFARRRYCKSDADGKFLLQIAQNMKVLSLLGITRQECETLEELQRRVKALPEVDSACGFIEKYELFLYAGRAADEQMLRQVINDGEILLKELKKERRIVYTVYRILQM